MESESRCACCADLITRVPAGKCTTCGTQNSVADILCTKCTSNHEHVGRLKTHLGFEKIVSPEAAYLAAHGLAPPPENCAPHPSEAAKLFCSEPGCSSSPLACPLCQFGGLHKGHTLATLDERARQDRTALTHALYSGVAGVPAVDPTPALPVLTEGGAAAVTAAAESVPLVVAPRTTALAIRALLDALPHHAGASQSDLDSARDALIAAAHAFHADRTAQLAAATQTQAAELQQTLAAADAVLEGARTAASALLEVRGWIESYLCHVHASYRPPLPAASAGRSGLEPCEHRAACSGPD